MRLSNVLRGRRVKKPTWPKDEWIKIINVSRDWVIATQSDGAETVFAFDKTDLEYELFYADIPLKPLREDYEEDEEEDD